MEELYDYVRHLHQRENQELPYDVQHKALIPVLRPYQSQAVNWMLRREKYRNTSPKGARSRTAERFLAAHINFNGILLLFFVVVVVTEQSMHFLWRELVTLCGKKLFYNPFTGW